MSSIHNRHRGWRAFSSFVPTVRSALALYVATLSLGALACADSPEERPLMRETEKIYAHLLAGRFDELERIETETRDLTRLTSDGQPLRGALALKVPIKTDGCSAIPSFDPATLAGLKVLRPKLDAWAKAKPQSRIAPILDADYYQRLAWATRGSKFSSGVDPAAWKEFYAYMETARQKLDAIKGPARSDPLWYTARLSVGVAQGMDEEKYVRLFMEALRAHPGYLDIYFVGLLYFMPQWHGSKEELLAAMKEAEALSTLPDKDVIYARMWWSAGGQDMFWRDGADWARMKKGMEALVAAYPDAWNLNAMGKFACIAQDRKTLRKVLAKIDKPLTVAWNGREMYDFCVMIAKTLPLPAPGVRHGKFTGTDIQTKTNRAGQYFYGKPVGTWTWTDESGKVVKTEEHPPVAEVKAQMEKEERENDAK